MFVVFLTLLFLGHEIPKHLMFSITNSIGYRLFYYQDFSQKDYEIKKGDYVVFSIDSTYIPDCHPCNVVKRIGCVAGEYLYSTDTRSYFCSDSFLGVAKTESKKGEPVDPFIYDGPVPDGYIFASGGHKDSYDSRYFGCGETKHIIGIAIPLI